MSAYTALALQTRCLAVNRCVSDAEARERMRANIERVGRQVLGSKAFIGPDLKLVVLPEYFLSGYPLGDALPAWASKAALAPDGVEYELLGQVARQAGVYLSGNAYETDAHFPGLYFQTSFVLDDQGACVLRYRRLVSLFAPTPHDVWDRYLELYGLEGVFPVADTPLGRLGCVASEEILYPEIARGLALRGAEVLLHSSSEVASPRLTPKDVAKRARAYENSCWVVSANSAGIVDVDIPGESVDGMSKIVDPLGEVRAEAGYGESMVAHAVIDIAALRRQRLKPGMGNLLARQRLELFAAQYADSVVSPNSMLKDGELQVPGRAHFLEQQRASIEKLLTRGVLRRD
ncbi:nitrilase-related carbon-nitrogen hydrolase [Inhella sp.]|uniref:nitrilase-related carbon-nitrogen hydrolase n=1 Tax=Inhella sp. TaxID=1921806 RepID=UPI0035B3CC18